MTKAEMRYYRTLLNAMPKPVKETLFFEDMNDAKEQLGEYGYKYLVGGYAFREANDIGHKDQGLKVNKTNGGGYKATAIIGYK